MVELLVVISIVALIGMSLYAMFASAMSMMQRVTRSEVDEDVGVFLEKLDREISSQVTYRGVPFDGKETSLSFPSRIGLDQREPLRGIGRITYSFDEFHRTFSRRQDNLNQIYKKNEEGAVPMLEGAANVKFQYFVYRKSEKIFEWVGVWNSLEHEGAIPYAVKVEFECVRGEERHVFEKTIAIPIAESAR